MAPPFLVARLLRQSHVRLSHLTALAVLAALVAAVFVATMGAGAQAVRFCNEGGTVLQGATANTCAIAVPTDAGSVTYTAATKSTNNETVTVSARDGDTGHVTVGAVEEGTDEVIVTRTDSSSTDDPTTMTYPITVLSTLAINLGDSDNVFSDGSSVPVTIVALHKAAAVSVDWVRVSGTLTIRNGEPTDANTRLGPVADVNPPAAGATDTTPFTPVLIIPSGAPEGEYTISAQLSNRNTNSASIATDGTGYSEIITAKFTVGEPGLGLATATLSLGVKDDKDTADTTDDVAETGKAAAANESIQLIVEGFNSLGNKANGGDINTISVIANGGEIDVQLVVPSTAPQDAQDADTALTPQDNTVAVTNTDLAPYINQRVVLSIAKANNKPGTVSVYAFLTGSGGAATTNTLELNFTGAASTIALGDATNTSAGGMSEFTIGGSDAGGNGTGVTGILYNVKDADGTPVGRNSSANGISAELGNVGDSTETKTDDNPLAQAVIVTVGPDVKPGDYTIEVSLVGVSDSAQTTTVTVAGHTASVDVSASQMESMTIGDVITVTATLSDVDGNLVADGVSVEFDVSQNTGLSPIGTGHGTVADEAARSTKGGSASVKYAVVGSGTSVISATAGVTGATGVAVVVSTAGSAEAMADEEASVACLSSLSGFATWACGVESSASEIFGLVSGRGATALHLWNGSAWVRYSVVDGTMVPGSSDFMVAENDILYISN